MKQLILGLVVGLVWIIVTAAVAWAVPPRGGDTQPDLAMDPHWQQRTPYNPVHYDRIRPGTQPTTTTSGAPRNTPMYVAPNAVKRAVRPPPSTPGVEQWRGLVAAQGGWDTELMLRIMGCESGGTPNARNASSGAAGLFQIYPARAGSFDPAINIAQAHAKWVASGYQPWVSSRSCWG